MGAMPSPQVADGAIDIKGVLIVYNEITKMDEDVDICLILATFFKAAESCRPSVSLVFLRKIRCKIAYYSVSCVYRI